MDSESPRSSSTIHSSVHAVSSMNGDNPRRTSSSRINVVASMDGDNGRRDSSTRRSDAASMGDDKARRASSSNSNNSVLSMDAGDYPRRTHSNDTVSSSRSSADLRPRDQGDEFTGLLLRLQQAHSNQVKELEHKLDLMRRKYKNLIGRFHTNYNLLKEIQAENRQLKEEKGRLGGRLDQLGHEQSISNLGKADDSGADDQDASEAVVMRQPTKQAPDENISNPDETTKPMRVSKLSKAKNNKKVRYSEMDSQITGSTQRDHAEIRMNKRSHSDGLKTSPTTIHRKSSRRKGQSVEASQELESDTHIVKKSVLVDELTESSKSQHVPAKILVPETCHPDDALESFIDLEDPYAGGDGGRQARMVSIPETLAIQGELDGQESFDESEFDPPTCASTPRNLTNSERSSSLRREKDDASQYDSLASKAACELTSHVDQYDDQQTVREFDNDETRFVSQHVSQVHRRTLPRSESQFPVDFSSTQHSPRFCGSRDDKEEEHDMDVKEILDMQKTPLNTHHGLQTRPITPQSITLNNASCQSEASLLLLQPPAGIITPVHNTTTPIAPQEQDTPSISIIQGVDNEDDVRPSTSSWKPNPRKRKIHLEDSFEDDNTTDKSNNVLEVSTSSQKQFSTSRVDEERSMNENDETNMNISPPDKENSPPCDDPSSPEKAPSTSRSYLLVPSNQLDISGMLIKSNTKGGKVMKQSRLSSSMFQAKNRIANTSLVEQYNGIGKVNLDSQRDESFARAIELSILENIETIDDNLDRGGRSEKQSEFKMPVLPNKRKSPRKRSEMDRTKDSTGRDQLASDRTKAKQKMSSHSRTDQHKTDTVSEDVVFDVIDDNRSAAVSKLSRKKRRTAQDNGTKVNNEVRKEKKIEEVQEIDDEDDNNSCEDLFGDDDADIREEVVPYDDVAMVTDDNDVSGGGITYPGRGEKRDADQSLGTRYAHDFDRIPSKASGPGYKYVDIVRKKEDRQRLKAFDCKQCEAFYKDMKLTDAEREERMKTCSRHRGHFSPPSTPEHYWSVGFPDTQTCLQRGYMQVSESSGEPHRKRGTKKYKQLF